ncbi:MAG: iron ABC transporter permease [Phycisphaerales bacterium]|nr:iron ABC transporter permease [Phycisphaerales bacterium]NNM27274.1 iron ABC transporter permease [Phycisphaerales bacterium]
MIDATPRRPLLALAILVTLVAGLAAVRLLIYRAGGGELTWGWPAGEIARLRLTSVAVATLVGAALGISGLLLQALLRNPLASPFVLGVSGGAALGVMTAISLEHAWGLAWARSGADAPAALVGALAALVIVYGLGQRRGWLDPVSLILIGVVVSAICGALIMFLQHLAPFGLRGDLVTWMMGIVPQGVSGMALAGSGIVVGLGAAGALGLGHAMDAATLGDDEARTVGLAVTRVRALLFVIAGVLASIAVALAGPIGFVGLIAPHAARLGMGPRHGRLVVGSAAAGAALLIGADLAAQVTSVGGGRMPVGVFTALLGGPTFIWLLRSGRGQA